MTENYSLITQNILTKRDRTWRIMGLSSLALSIAFLLMAIFLNWCYAFAFAGLLAVGTVAMHVYSATAKEFVYELGGSRLTISKRDLFGRQRRILSIMLEDIKGFSPIEEEPNKSDVLACSELSNGIYQVVLGDVNATHRVLIEPDKYMTALMSEKLKNTTKQCENNQTKS